MRICTYDIRSLCITTTTPLLLEHGVFMRIIAFPLFSAELWLIGDEQKPIHIMNKLVRMLGVGKRNFSQLGVFFPFSYISKGVSYFLSILFLFI